MKHLGAPISLLVLSVLADVADANQMVVRDMDGLFSETLVEIRSGETIIWEFPSHGTRRITIYNDV